MHLLIARGNKQSTIAQNLILLKLILELAYKNGWIFQNPFINYKIEDEKSERGYLITNSSINFIWELLRRCETMNLIRQNKKDIPESGQLIYSELAVEEFPKVKEYLLHEVGYKPEEVGIITEATSKANRLNSG